MEGIDTIDMSSFCDRPAKFYGLITLAALPGLTRRLDFKFQAKIKISETMNNQSSEWCFSSTLLVIIGVVWYSSKGSTLLNPTKNSLLMMEGHDLNSLFTKNHHIHFEASGSTFKKFLDYLSRLCLFQRSAHNMLPRESSELFIPRKIVLAPT